ncbi:MAG TPA: phosphatidate cytidylyltransferase [Flavobacterium sp.]|nr:phosphatidate cytidylyltransferase [Flavobacterium sp.]
MNELVTRSLSGIVYIALLVGALVLSDVSFLLLFGLFFLLAIYEFCKLYQIKKIIGFAIALFISSSLFLVHNSELNSIYLTVIPFSTYLIFDLFRNNFSSNHSFSQKIIHLTGYVVVPFLILTQLPFNNNQYTPFILLSIFVMMWCNDTFAYICGRLFGKHKLYEKISPKKTIEGFVGGLFFTQIAAFFVFKLLPVENISLIFWVAIGLTVSIMGTLGDLIESKYKRQANVKDSGTIMPGHGGILDRLDSILFAAPFLFLIYKIIL